MKKLQKQAGFTLIELVIVIVILGILAATAAPKFVDLTNDAKISVMEGVDGALNSATDMAHAKALVKNQMAAAGDISVAGINIELVYGWPKKSSLPDLLELDSDVNVSDGVFSYNGATNSSTCQVVYVETSDTNIKPVITPSITDCN
jgi:MSHA pilin protein MshA